MIVNVSMITKKQMEWISTVRLHPITRICKLTAMMMMMACLSACTNKQTPYLGVGGEPVKPGSQRDLNINVGNIIYFTTNSTQLTPEAQKTLLKQAQWLSRYKQYTITLEGHADERGTREYNLALGARRAQTVRTYLQSQGISPSRMRTLSFGKERPVALCDDISCWSQNRRVITKLNAGAAL